jgi:hypothetical protein
VPEKIMTGALNYTGTTIQGTAYLTMHKKWAIMVDYSNPNSHGGHINKTKINKPTNTKAN